MKLVYETHHDIQFFVKGTAPSLLIHAGTHGDEFEVIDSVTWYIEAHYDMLPDFLYVPRVSPSAVLKKTRVNVRGIDVNRHFLENDLDPEVRANIELVKRFSPFDMTISFHEDSEFNAFYLYDSGDEVPDAIDGLREVLRKAQVSLFTGIDDENDPVLAHQIHDGYAFITELNPESGMFSDWALSNRLVKRAVVPEIPGKADQGNKDHIVEMVMDYLLKLGRFSQDASVNKKIFPEWKTSFSG